MELKQKYVAVFISLVAPVLLSGCWSKTELNELAIATAMAIDKAEDGYLINVQVLNPSQIASQQQPLTTETAVTSYQAAGETIFEALRKLTVEIPGKLYLAHIRIIIFGEEVAKEGIRKPLDFLSRDHEMRTDFYLLVAKHTKAAPLLNVLTSLEKIPANSIYTTLQMSEIRWAPTKGVRLDELIENLVKKGQEAVLTGIYVKGDIEVGNSLRNIEFIDPPAVLMVDNLAAFYGDQLVGWLDLDESKGYNYILGKVKSTIVEIPCDQEENDRLALEIIDSTSEMKGKVANGKPAIDITVKIEANVGEVECKIDLTDPKKIKELEKKTKEKIKQEIEKVVERAQGDFKSDILGFGEAIHRNDPKAWRSLKNNWKEHFPTVAFHTKVDVEIQRLGTIVESFQEESED